MIRIFLPGPPLAKQRPRFGQGNVHTASRTRAYETALAWEGKRAMVGRKPLIGALKVTVHAWMPIPKSWNSEQRSDAVGGDVRPVTGIDWDNIGKSLDGLNKIVWLDDAQIVDGRVIKYYSHKPRLEIEIEEIA